MLNKNKNIIYFEKPYKTWVVDNFLNTSTLENIKKEWPPSDDSDWHGGHEYIGDKINILEQGMLSYDIKDTTGYLNNFLESLHSVDFTKQISTITGIENLIPDVSKRWSGIRVMKPGSFQAIHSDARLNPESGLTKTLTCLIYFNDNWLPEHNGYLELWDDSVQECVQKIQPLNNRLVIFLNTKTSYHGVPKVDSNRKSITWSILKKDSNETRTKALFVSRPQDDKQITELGKQRALINDAHK